MKISLLKVISLLLLFLLFLSCKKAMLVSYDIETIESLTIKHNNYTIKLNSDKYSSIKKIYDQFYSTPVWSHSNSDKIILQNADLDFLVVINYSNTFSDSIYIADNGNFLYKKQQNNINLCAGPNNEITIIINDIIQAYKILNYKELKHEDIISDQKDEYPEISINEDSLNHESYNEYDLECPDCDEPVYYLENIINDLYYWNDENIYILTYIRTENYSKEGHEELYRSGKNATIMFTAIHDTSKIQIYNDFSYITVNSEVWNSILLDSLFSIYKSISNGNSSQKLTRLERSQYLEKKIEVEMHNDSVDYFSYRYKNGNTQIYLDRIYNNSGVNKEIEKIKCFQGYNNELIIITSISYSYPIEDWGVGIHTEDLYFITDKISLEP